ncbi:MAG: hypothetical protein WBV94_22535 [Blastocatellia bacterium]
MTSIITFESNVYSEEIFAGISEADYNEVMMAPTVEDGWQGYSKWSTELEQGTVIDTPRGQILINRACSHAACRTTRCEKGATYHGIAI